MSGGPRGAGSGRQRREAIHQTDTCPAFISSVKHAIRTFLLRIHSFEITPKQIYGVCVVRSLISKIICKRSRCQWRSQSIVKKRFQTKIRQTLSETSQKSTFNI